MIFGRNFFIYNNFHFVFSIKVPVKLTTTTSKDSNAVSTISKLELLQIGARLAVLCFIYTHHYSRCLMVWWPGALCSIPTILRFGSSINYIIAYTSTSPSFDIVK